MFQRLNVPTAKQADGQSAGQLNRQINGQTANYMYDQTDKQKVTTPKALSRESFEKIRDFKIPENRRSHILTRDLFLFACYTGTSYADIVRITKENLFTDEQGSLWLKYARKKTDYRARVKLLPEAIALLEKYKDESRGTLFPRQSAEVVQLNMRGLRIMADIKQPISYHAGRHSFATIMKIYPNQLYINNYM